MRNPNSLSIVRPARRSWLRRGFLATVVGSLVLVAMPVEAHVEATPAVVKPGVKATITLTVPHGCLSSPTIKLAVKLPATVTGAVPVAPKGWKGMVSGSVATFTGGPLPVKQTARFGITFTAPKTEGTLAFPTVQTCVKGENAWIQKPLANGAEPDYPIPTVVVSSKTSKAK